MERMMTLAALRTMTAAHGSALWEGRTSDYEDEDNTHLTAWAWVERPDDVDLAGATVEVRHPQHTGGEWVTIEESR